MLSSPPQPVSRKLPELSLRLFWLDLAEYSVRVKFRAKALPPFSREAGNCATCIAQLTEGRATMRVNDASTDEEMTLGYILTCQGVPDTPSVTVVYE